MKNRRARTSRSEAWLASLACSGGLLAALAGCTVVPDPLRDSVASFDGNTQNSGFLGYDPAGNAVLTPGARARYNLLVLRFGTNYLPALTLDAGVTATATNTYLLDRQHWVDALEMNGWRKAGR